MQWIARPLRQRFLRNDVRDVRYNLHPLGSWAPEPVTTGYASRCTSTLHYANWIFRLGRQQVPASRGRGLLNRAYATENVGASYSNSSGSEEEGDTARADEEPHASMRTSKATRASVNEPQPSSPPASRWKMEAASWPAWLIAATSPIRRKEYEELLTSGTPLPSLPGSNGRWDWLLLKGNDVASISEVWAEVPEKDRRRYWRAAMLLILYHYPQLLSNALEATYMKPFPPPHPLADYVECAVYIDLRIKEQEQEQEQEPKEREMEPKEWEMESEEMEPEEQETEPEKREMEPEEQEIESEKREMEAKMPEWMVRSVKRLVDFNLKILGTATYPRVRPHTIRLLMKYADADQASELYSALSRRKIKINALTGFKLATSLARKGLLAQTSDMVKRLARNRAARQKYLSEFMQVCTSVLWWAGNLTRGRAGLRILNEILGYGVQPDLFVYNVSIGNALLGGQVSMAWRIYGLLKEQDILPDAVTFTLLMKEARRRASWDRIELITDEMRAYGVKPDALLASEMLYTCYFYMHKEHGRSALATMQKVYETYFSTDILRELGIMQGAAPDSAPVKPAPTPAAVNHMFWAYLRYSADQAGLAELYGRYRTAVAANREWAPLLTSSAHIPTAFILALGRSRDTLVCCPAIMADMLSPTSGLPKPTVETWTVLLYAYVQHDQLLAAEKVLERMQAHGYTPNFVTWMTLLSRYAKRQRVVDVARVLKHVYRAGYQLDSGAIRALTEIKDRLRLAHYMATVEREVLAERLEAAVLRLQRRKLERRARRARYLRERNAEPRDQNLRHRNAELKGDPNLCRRQATSARRKHRTKRKAALANQPHHGLKARAWSSLRAGVRRKGGVKLFGKHRRASTIPRLSPQQKSAGGASRSRRGRMPSRGGRTRR